MMTAAQHEPRPVGVVVPFPVRVRVWITETFHPPGEQWLTAYQRTVEYWGTREHLIREHLASEKMFPEPGKNKKHSYAPGAKAADDHETTEQLTGNEWVTVIRKAGGLFCLKLHTTLNTPLVFDRRRFLVMRHEVRHESLD